MGKKRTAIIVETERLFVSGELIAWCSACGKLSPRVSVEMAATLIGADAQTVYGMAEAGTLHGVRTRSDSLLICLNSLQGPTDF